MAVTVTDVALDLRLIAEAEAELEAGVAAIVARHLGAAAAMVETRAPSAPEALADAATIAIAAYLFDRPSAPSGSRFASAWTNSGASAMLARYVRRRARSIGTGGASAAPSGGGTPGVDPVARAEAADALERANDANTLAGQNLSDLFALRGDLSQLTPDVAEAKRVAEANLATIQEFGPRLTAVGDVQSVMLGTAANFAAALEAQVASNKPLWLVADAAFVGQIDGADFPVAVGEVYWFAPGSNSPEALFTIPQPRESYLPASLPNRLTDAANYALGVPPAGAGAGVGPIWRRIISGDADLSAYRTAADQDVIDDRATAGIILARQEARAADGKAVAAQEAIPADVPDAPAAAAAAVDYSLRRPARGSASEETLWVPRPAVRGVTDAQAAKLAGITVNDETAARLAADTALGGRIDALAGYAAPVFDPDYWVKTGDARSILVHLDPRADAVAGLAKLRLTVQGIQKTVARTPSQDVYEFAFSAADAANITRAAGNAGSDTVRADVDLLDRNDALLQPRWRGLLRVLDEAPAGGGGGIPAGGDLTLINGWLDGTGTRQTGATARGQFKGYFQRPSIDDNAGGARGRVTTDAIPAGATHMLAGVYSWGAGGNLFELAQMPATAVGDGSDFAPAFPAVTLTGRGDMATPFGWSLAKTADNRLLIAVNVIGAGRFSQLGIRWIGG